MSGSGTIHIVGAGLAGLAGAVRSVQRGAKVCLYESALRAGGRCRSFHDAKLDRTLDNGNHLLLSGNRATMDYLRTVKSLDRLVGPPRAAFPFVDLRTGERWCIRPSRGPVPWWICNRQRRIPGTTLRDYASALRLLTAGEAATVLACVGDAGVLFERFWTPLAVGALNAPVHEGAARLLGPVLKETFAKGEAYCRPRIARHGLSDAFVVPALTWLRDHGASIHLSHRLRALPSEGSRVAALDFGNTSVSIGEHDRVILAVPSWVAAMLLPDVTVPEGQSAIVNAHFLLPFCGADLFLGILGGTAQWIFFRDDVASVTVSAAGPLARKDNDALAYAIWQDVAKTLGIASGAPPPFRIIKEKRATFRQVPGNLKRRPGAATHLENVFLAGDWTNTGLPATIEGAVRSGFTAAQAALR